MRRLQVLQTTYHSEKKRFVESEDSEGYLIPDVLHADEEAGEERITMTDDIPFED